MPNQPPLNPDAIEAGAKALFLRERKYHTPSIECPEPPNWEDLTETSMEHYRANARAVLAVAQPEGWEQQAKNFMRVIDRLTAENEALKAAEQKAHSDAGWAANMDRQGGA